MMHGQHSRFVKMPHSSNLYHSGVGTQVVDHKNIYNQREDVVLIEHKCSFRFAWMYCNSFLFSPLVNFTSVNIECVTQNTLCWKERTLLSGLSHMLLLSVRWYDNSWLSEEESNKSIHKHNVKANLQLRWIPVDFGAVLHSLSTNKLHDCQDS